MFPTIDRRATGVNIRRIMDRKNISVKDLQHYLELGSIQSIYHWLNGICLPSLDNLYAMSAYFQMPMDDLICGNSEYDIPKRYYYDKIHCVVHWYSTLVVWEHFPAGVTPDFTEVFLTVI